MAPSLVDALPQAFQAYALAPLADSPQQFLAIEAIDSAIDALRQVEQAVGSVGGYFGSDGIPDIYLDSHLHQTSDLLGSGSLSLPYALRSTWNAHLSGRTSLLEVSSLVQQAIAALAQATWFLDSAKGFFGNDYPAEGPIEQDLQRLQVLLHPGTPPSLHVL